MLINELCSRNSYKAISGILNGITLHDLQCIDVLKMIANKKSLVIYDTGTGKTLLVGAAMRLLLREDPSRLFVMFVKKDQLVQTPTKLREMAGLSCIVTNAESEKVHTNFLSKNLEDYNVIMLTHECLHNSAILDALYDIKDKITGVIIDEAHEYNNFNKAGSANMLKAIVRNVEYVWSLTATPIVSDLMQLARIANVTDATRYTDANKLYRDMTNGSFKVKYDKAFFINRKASELGRYSNPNGYVVSVSPQPYQKDCTTGGVELFQVCKGRGAINQVNALIDLIQEKHNANARGLVFISQTSILNWVKENLINAGIKYACINGSTPLEQRHTIESDFAQGEFDVILTSVTTAVDLDCEYVVFYEFTVMVNQMIGRAHRGLKPKELDVYFIITQDTREVDYFIENIYGRCQIVREILEKGNTAVEEAARQLEV